MKSIRTTLLLCLGLISPALAAESPPTLALGAAAPDFELPGVDGRNWKLNDFASSKALVVIFTCNHCPTAQYYEERIKKLTSDYKARGVAVVAISPNDPKSVRLDELGWADLSDTLAEMRIRAKDAEFNFPYLYDGDTQATSRAYGAVATPHVFLFDSERKLRYVGAIDDSERPAKVSKHYLREALDALLAGTEPPVKQTKVVGCSVKWAGKEAQVKAFMEKLAAEPVTLAKADAATIAALRKNDSGKFRLVNFWATWCAPCVAEFHEFVEVNRMYRHREFEFVAVSMNQPDEEKRVLDFLKKKEASNRNYIFASAEREPLINAFDPQWQGEAPYTVLLDPEGKVIYKQTDSVDFLALKRAIVNALNERKPW